MMIFRLRYFILFISILIIEILIALFPHDGFIRPYVGDFLVVILLYCFIKTFLKITVIKVALGVLIFSYLVEYLQYLHLIKFLGLQNSSLAKTILGTSFEWTDIAAYTLGILFVIFVETKIEP
jgi:hypothetical protein